MRTVKTPILGPSPTRQLLCCTHRVAYLGCTQEIAKHLTECRHPSRCENHPSGPASNGGGGAQENCRIGLPHSIGSQDAKSRSSNNQINNSRDRNASHNGKRDCCSP